MSNMRLSVALAALGAAVLSLACIAPVEAHPPVSVHVGVGVGYPGPLRGWRGGYWHRGWYGPRYGWWWVVGPSWYYYPQPVYPYPNPYPPVIVQTEPAKPGPAPAQYWYYCAASKAYYPYVAECPGGWQPVPVTPTPPPPAVSHPGR